MRSPERSIVDPPLFPAVAILSLFSIALICFAGVLNTPDVITEGASIRQIRWFVIALVAYGTLTRVRLWWFG